MYSRVGTADWVPKARTKEEFNRIVEQLLNENIDWIDGRKLKVASKVIANVDQLSAEELRREIDRVDIVPGKDQILAVTEDVLRDAGLGLEEAELRRFINRLRNSPQFSSLVK